MRKSVSLEQLLEEYLNGSCSQNSFAPLTDVHDSSINIYIVIARSAW